MLDSLPQTRMGHPGVPPPPAIRRVVLNDLPWLLSVAYQRYGAYDPGPILTRLAEMMQRPDWLVMRSAHAFAISNLFVPAWRTQAEPECNVVILCAEPGGVWDAVRVLRESVRWARQKGCTAWWFGSETEVDISAIARRVGGVKALPRYRIGL